MTVKQYQLPSRFYDDHRSRDCGETGVIVKRTKRTVTVALDEDAYRDLHSDADYYATLGEGDAWLRGLAVSARATLKRLDVDPN